MYFRFGGFMQANISIKICLLLNMLFLSHDASAEGWFQNLSDMMVKIPWVGNYFMDDTQKQIYGFEQKKKEAEQIRSEFHSEAAEGTAAQAIKQLQDCKALLTTLGYPDEKRLSSRFQGYIRSIGNITGTKAAPRDYTLLPPHVDLSTIIESNLPPLLLTPEEIERVRGCAKKSSGPEMKKLSRLIELTDDINKFRKSRLYIQNHVPVTKRGKQLKEEIDVRADAYYNKADSFAKEGFPDSLRTANLKELRDKSQSKEFPLNPFGYYVDILRVFKKDGVTGETANTAVLEHIGANLKKLRSEQAALEAARKKINIYRTIDE